MSGTRHDAGTPQPFRPGRVQHMHAGGHSFKNTTWHHLLVADDLIVAAMFVISPMSNCGSVDKRERVSLGFIRHFRYCIGADSHMIHWGSF